MSKNAYVKQYEKQGIYSLLDLEAFIDQDAVKGLIGEKHDHYRNVWLTRYRMKIMGENIKMPSGTFTWLALLSPIIWLAYRKIWPVFFMICGFLLIVIMVEKIYDFQLNSGGIAGASVVFAFMAKDMYFGHIYRLVEKYKNLPNNERKAKFLKIHGGTSKAFALLSIPLFILSVFLMLMTYNVIIGDQVF